MSTGTEQPDETGPPILHRPIYEQLAPAGWSLERLQPYGAHRVVVGEVSFGI